MKHLAGRIKPRDFVTSVVLVALTASASAQAIVLEDSEPVSVSIDLTSLLCDETTGDWGSDEVIVRGAWVRHGGNSVIASGLLALPAPTTSYNPPLPPMTTYGHYGSIDDNEWVFTSRKTAWSGVLLDGQSVSVMAIFWEKDSGSSSASAAEDFMLDMVQSMGEVLITGGLSWTSAFQLAWDLVGAIYGPNDKLGMFTVTATNHGGVISKSLDVDAGRMYYQGQFIQLDQAHIGSAHYNEYRVLSYWDLATRQEMIMQGFSVLTYNFNTVTMRRVNTYPGLSSDRRTVRAVLKANGKYQASIQVRADGSALPWTLIDSQRAN